MAFNVSKLMKSGYFTIWLHICMACLEEETLSDTILKLVSERQLESFINGYDM